MSGSVVGGQYTVATISFINTTPTGSLTINGYSVQTGDEVLFSANTPPQIYIKTASGAWTPSRLLSSFPVYTQFISTASSIINQVYTSQPDNTIALSNTQLNIVSLFTWDTTITPTGIKTLDEIATTTGTRVLICAGASIGEWICNDAGAWTQVRNGAAIHLAALQYYSTNGVGYKGGTVFPISDSYLQLQYPTVSIGATTVNNITGIDSTNDVNNAVPFKSLEYAREQLNNSGGAPERSTVNIQAGESGTGIINETIKSEFFNNGTNQTIAGDGGQVYVNNTVFNSSDTFNGTGWTNITYAGINLGVNYVVDAAIEFTQTSTNNISVEADSTISFDAVGVSQLGSVTNKALLVDASFKGNAYVDITGYDMAGDVDVSGRFQVDMYNIKQYTRANTITMRNAAYNNTIDVTSAYVFHGADFHYYGHTVNHGGGALMYKNVTSSQILTINSTGDLVTDSAQIEITNSVITLSATQTGNAPWTLRNVDINGTDPTTLVGWTDSSSWTAPMNIGCQYVVPTTGNSITWIDHRDNMRLAPITDLASFTITMPQDDYVRDGQKLYLFSTHNIATLTITPNTGQSMSSTITTITANSLVIWCYKKVGKEWSVWYNGSAQVTLTGTQALTNKTFNNLSVTTLGGGLSVKAGTNGKGGTATLTAGTVVVANTSITANSVIHVSCKTVGGTQGALYTIPDVGVGFTITSTSATDTSVVNYIIFELN